MSCGRSQVLSYLYTFFFFLYPQTTPTFTRTTNEIVSFFQTASTLIYSSLTLFHGKVENISTQQSLPVVNTGMFLAAEKCLTPETAPKLTYKEYRNLGGELIPLYYCTSLEAAEHGGQQLLVALEYSETRVVGVGFVAGLGAGASERDADITSLQFAVLGQKGCIVIIHSALFPAKLANTAGLPRSITTILSSSDILKLGHGAAEFRDSIHKCLGIEGHAFFELGHTHSLIQEKTLLAHEHVNMDAQAQPFADNQAMAWGGLDELIFSYLGKRLDRVRQKGFLMTEEMREYVASRALCGPLLYHAMAALQQLPPSIGPVSTDPLRLPIVALPVHLENVHVATPDELVEKARRKQEQHTRERGRKDRQHQAEFDELNPDSQALYKSLALLRDNLLKSTGLPPYKVSDTKNIYLLACEKPITVEDLREIKMKVKATQGQFAYDFVNVVRLHLGFEVLVEPLGYQREYREERDSRV